MNLPSSRRSLTLWFAIAAFACRIPIQAEPRPAAPKLYDETANGSQQIADALATAKKDGKRVLLQFGANWCGWCHKLHGLFASDPDVAGILKATTSWF